MADRARVFRERADYGTPYWVYVVRSGEGEPYYGISGVRPTWRAAMAAARDVLRARSRAV